MKILVTGVAGFTGSHTATRLLDRGDKVVGLDIINNYYDPLLREARIARLSKNAGFRFVKLDLADRSSMSELLRRGGFARVVHLGAQAGVWYSIENPLAYVDSNLIGMANILEGCRYGGVEHLAYASSSSVYGAKSKIPFSVHQSVDHPISLSMQLRRKPTN